MRARGRETLIHDDLPHARAARPRRSRRARCSRIKRTSTSSNVHLPKSFTSCVVAIVLRVKLRGRSHDARPVSSAQRAHPPWQHMGRILFIYPRRGGGDGPRRPRRRLLMGPRAPFLRDAWETKTQTTPEEASVRHAHRRRKTTVRTHLTWASKKTQDVRRHHRTTRAARRTARDARRATDDGRRRATRDGRRLRPTWRAKRSLKRLVAHTRARVNIERARGWLCRDERCSKDD